jgi:hypothetical protein
LLEPVFEALEWGNQAMPSMRAWLRGDCVNRGAIFGNDVLYCGLDVFGTNVGKCWQ